jgi:hypothetical protein
MSPEDLLELSLASDGAQSRVDRALGHDERESTVDGLGVRSRTQKLFGLVELGLIDSDVLVTPG